MVGLRWLKLDRTGLKEVPEEIGKLHKLVRLFTCSYCMNYEVHGCANVSGSVCICQQCACLL